MTDSQPGDCFVAKSTSWDGHNNNNIKRKNAIKYNSDHLAIAAAPILLYTAPQPDDAGNRYSFVSETFPSTPSDLSSEPTFSPRPPRFSHSESRFDNAQKSSPSPIFISLAQNIPRSMKSPSILEEIETVEKEAKKKRRPSKSEARIEEKDQARAGINTLPSNSAVRDSMLCNVYSETGRHMRFSEVLRENVKGPTIVVFVRHMWCGLCQEFLKSLSHIDTRLYARYGVEVVVVGCGDPALIGRYKAVANFSGRMYSDPSGGLQETLGMTFRTLDAGKDSEKGEYQQTNLLVNGLTSAANGLRMFTRHPGLFSRLGGEFVFDVATPSADAVCLYAHRMVTTRSHGSIANLFAAAGVYIPSTLITPRQPSLEAAKAPPSNYALDSICLL